jgi:proteasome lid subunit RPN8/RPN11
LKQLGKKEIVQFCLQVKKRRPNTTKEELQSLLEYYLTQNSLKSQSRNSTAVKRCEFCGVENDPLMKVCVFCSKELRTSKGTVENERMLAEKTNRIQDINSNKHTSAISIVDDICSYCDRRIEYGAAVIVCPECGEKHHAACWEANEHRCSMPKCEGTELVDLPEEGGLGVSDVSELPYVEKQEATYIAKAQSILRKVGEKINPKIVVGLAIVLVAILIAVAYGFPSLVMADTTPAKQWVKENQKPLYYVVRNNQVVTRISAIRGYYSKTPEVGGQKFDAAIVVANELLREFNQQADNAEAERIRQLINEELNWQIDYAEKEKEHLLRGENQQYEEMRFLYDNSELGSLLQKYGISVEHWEKKS